MDKLPFFLLYVGSWLSICGGIAFLFNFAGDSVKNETKQSLARGLKNLDLTKEYNWPAIFADLFDSVFTKRYFSLKCFLRSCLASFLAVGIMNLVYLGRGGIMDPTADTLILFLILTVLYNVIPDYLSLLESRYIIKRMSQSNSSFKWLLWLFVDLVTTGFIFIFISYLIGRLFFIVLGVDICSFLSYFTQIFKKDTLFMTGNGNDIVIYFYSTFFTSVWVWLYAISGFVLKIVARTQGGLRFLQDKLDVDNKPFRAMGFTLVLIVTAGYFIGGIYMVLF